MSKAIDVFLEHLRLILEGEYEDEGDNKLSLFDQFIFSISDNENSNSSITKPKGIGQDIKKYVRDLSKLIDDLIDLIDSDLIDHLHQIEEEAKADILRDELIEEAIELLNEARANMDRSFWKIRKLIDSLENILDSLDEGVYVPTREQRLAQDMFRMRNRTAKHYFSWLLSEIPVFMEDAPYCFIERVFENPHDKPINVEIREGKDSRRIKQSMHQFMRDMLPGSWNHRLSKSGTGHSLRSPVGGNGAQQRQDLGNIRVVNLALHNNDNLFSSGIDGTTLRVEEYQHTFDSEVVPKVIRMKHDSKALRILRQNLCN